MCDTRSVNPDRWQIVQEVFHEASGIPPGPERDAAIRERCGDDAELLTRVEELLAGSDDMSDTFLEPPTLVLQDDDRPPSLTGSTVGSCVLGELLGEGGMGAVYAARQLPTNRLVAVKIMRSLGHAEARRRFEFEARVLANLTHGGIAQVYETGTHDAGSGLLIPYIVMEFVEGAATITEWCSKRGPDIRARSAIVREVCDAVHHGHLKGVIHRDLKPANILVDAEGRPKVIDFGVAHVTDSDSWDRSFQTVEGQVIGTPAYMSPEQLGGHQRDIDARTDVYSLGAVLYELMTGERPHAFNGPFDECVRAVRDDPAPRPSRLTPELDTDLDTIVTTALAKDRDKRYASAAALGQDIDNWLQGRPIQARPLTLGYQLRLFTARNRGVVAAGVAVAAILAAATVVSSSMAIKAARAEAAERARADESERVAARTSEFSEWVAREFQLNIGELPGATPLRRELLDRVRNWLDDITIGESPPRLRLTVARSYVVAAQIEGSGTGFSDPDQALLTNAKAVAILERLHADRPDDMGVRLALAKAQVQRAGFLMETAGQNETEGVLAAAEALLDRIDDDAPDTRSLVKELRASVAMTRANRDRDAGRWKEAIAGMAKAVRLLGTPENPDDANLRDWTLYLDWRLIQLQAVWQHGDEKLARDIWNEIAPVIQRVAPTDDRSVSARAFRARAAFTKGEFESFADGANEAALKSYGEAERILSKLHEDDPINTGFQQSLGLVLSRMGKLLFSMNRLKEALPIAERDVAIHRRLHQAAPDSERAQLNLRISLSHLGMTLLLVGQTEEALQYANEALELAETLVDSDPDGIDQQTAMAEALTNMGTSVLRTMSGAPDDIDIVRKARAHYARSTRIYRRVLEAAPDTWGVESRIDMNLAFIKECDKLLGNQ